MKTRTVWTVVALVGAYLVCQAIADVSATKFIELGGVVLPAGSFIFAATFTLRDLLHKRLGRQWARATIVMAAVFNVIQAAYLAWTARLPWPPFYQHGEAWQTIFAVVPAITVASIIAEVVSELTDTEVYHFWRTRLARLPQWSAVVASNGVSLPLDSFVFGTLAFVVLPPFFGGEALPLLAAMQLVVGQIVWKAIVTLVSLPTIYLVKEQSAADALVFSR